MPRTCLLCNETQEAIRGSQRAGTPLHCVNDYRSLQRHRFRPWTHSEQVGMGFDPACSENHQYDMFQPLREHCEACNSKGLA